MFEDITAMGSGKNCPYRNIIYWQTNWLLLYEEKKKFSPFSRLSRKVHSKDKEIGQFLPALFLAYKVIIVKSDYRQF